LIIDEFMSAYNYGLINQKEALDFLLNRPGKLEVVLTGRDPGQEILNLADYVTEMKKVKHPFDQGIPARKGIEM
ncbi:MAG TPA: cob(I)yrinic acid a,c-diamide adenosyltransferase, partial [Lachnospiraceae bacterium]|nr:cob(I)yrinic acid a,c-diamide adenosyltransferase [Lachnospiraceae bacterium]